MSTVQIVLIVWGVVTAGLILLLIYRSTLIAREDDQLFLEPGGESLMQKEQKDIQTKLQAIAPLVL